MRDDVQQRATNSINGVALASQTKMHASQTLVDWSITSVGPGDSTYDAHTIKANTPMKLRTADADNKTMLIISAVRDDDGDALAALIGAGGDVNERDENNRTAIAVAVECNHWSIVLQLLKSGATAAPEAANPQRRTLLDMAVWHNRDDVVDALLAAGADVRVGLPLHHATSAGMVRKLVAAGADVDAVDQGGATALLVAVGSDELTAHAVVEALIDAGADVDLADHPGKTPLHLAVDWRDVRMAQMLLAAGAVATTGLEKLRKVDVLWLAVVAARVDLIADDDDCSAIEFGDHVPVPSHNVAAVLQRLAQLRVCWNLDKALEQAAGAGLADVVDELVRVGANASAGDALAEAARGGHAALVTKLLGMGCVDGGAKALLRAAGAGQAECVAALLRAGADVNAVGEFGAWDRRGQGIVLRSTPIGAAALMKRWPIVQQLLAAGARLEAGNDRWTLLHLVVAEREATATATVALIAAGADVEQRARRWGAENISCLQHALKRRNFAGAELLLAAGASPRTVALQRHLSQRQLALLLAAGADELVDPERRSAALAGVSAAKRRIERAGFAAIRSRLLEISVALGDLQLPAPLLIEIVTHACEPFARHLPYFWLWNGVVLVKHFVKR